ncbi:MAG: hypothetical protein HRU19_26180 [Pseudobacteriovorax sp.]|nr:hypothetical protein [Pseudobacteriovorax sp.]
MSTKQVASLESEEIVEYIKRELGVDGVRSGSDFSKAMGRLLSKELEDSDESDCLVLLNGLENILETQARYSNISVEIIVRLSKITGHPPKKIISSISRNTNKLKVPTVSWVNKNLRVADVVASYPELSNIDSVEKIDAIRRLDDDKIEKIAESGSVIDVEGQELKVNETPAPKLRKAINEIIKVDKDEMDEAPQSEVGEANPVLDPLDDQDESQKIIEDLSSLYYQAIKVIPEDHPKQDVMMDILARIKEDMELLKSHLANETTAYSTKADDIEESSIM